MEKVSSPEHKINIFALPSQTTLLFCLVVAVLLGTVALGSMDDSPVLVWPLALGLLVLPWRAYLAQPDRQILHERLYVPGDNYASLIYAIEKNAVGINLRRAPKLLLSPRSRTIRAMGTFTRWFLIAGEGIAQDLQNRLDDPEKARQAHALILHELYHFKNGDHWKLGFVVELFRLTFKFVGWAIAVSFGMGVLLILAAPYFTQFNLSDQISQLQTLPPEMKQILLEIMPTPESMAVVQQRAEMINFYLVLNFIVSAFLPLVVVGLVLWKLVWPKLCRTREFYADAGVIQTQMNVNDYMLAFLPFTKSDSDGDQDFSKRGFPGRFLDALKSFFGGISYPQVRYGSFHGRAQAAESITTPIDANRHTIRGIWKSIKNLGNFHPNFFTRMEALQDPRIVFDNWWKTAFFVGGLALLLDILLSSPLTLLQVGYWPMHFTTLVVFVILSIGYLIPATAAGRNVWFELLKLIGVVTGIRLLWILIIIATLFSLLIFAPGFLSEALEHAVASVAGYAGYSAELGFDHLTEFVVMASVLNTAQVFVIFLVLLGSLYLSACLFYRLFTWFNLPKSDKLVMKIALLIVGVEFIFLSITILPFLTTLLLRPSDLLHPLGIFLGLFGLAIMAAGLGLFFLADRKYARKCPACHTQIAGRYEPGKRCPSCESLFFPWLIAEYET